RNAVQGGAREGRFRISGWPCPARPEPPGCGAYLPEPGRDRREAEADAADAPRRARGGAELRRLFQLHDSAADADDASLPAREAAAVGAVVTPRVGRATR